MKKIKLVKFWKVNSNKRATTSLMSAIYLTGYVICFACYRVWELAVIEAVLALVLYAQTFIIKELPPEKTMASVKVTPIVNTIHAVVAFLFVGPVFGTQYYLLGMDSATGGSLKDSKLYRSWFFILRVFDAILFVLLYVLVHKGFIIPKYSISGVFPTIVYCYTVITVVFRKALIEAANAYADVSFVEDENKEKQAALSESAKKSAFISGISHELRTPVNAIVGMNKLILRDTDDPVITGYAGEIEKAGNDLMNLLDEVTAFNGGKKRESGKRNISFSAKGAKVLLVDDTAINLKLLGNYLKDSMMSLCFATSGEEALNLCENEKFDLLLLDSMMPKMTGEELLWKIKKTGHNVNTPAVVVTADAVGNSRDHYIQAGFDEFLSKPVDFAQLDEVMVKYLPKELVCMND